MDTPESGARAEAPTPNRLTARELFFGRRLRVHRLIGLTVVAALVLVTAYVIKVGQTSGLESLAGVTRVDRDHRTVVLSPTVTPAEVAEVFDRARQLSGPWTLMLGPARLATTGDRDAAVTNSRNAVNLMHRFGTAALAEPAVITLDAYAPVIIVQPDRWTRTVSAARIMIIELSADGVAGVERLTVQGEPTVIVQPAALARPAESDAVLAVLERVPGLHQTVLADRVKAQVRVDDEPAATPACAAARKALGDRTDIELSVMIGDDTGSESEIRRC